MAARDSVRAAEKRALILSLKMEGHDWPQIAAKIRQKYRCHFTTAQAAAEGKAALEEVQAQLKSMAPLHLALELARIDEQRREAYRILEEARAEGHHLNQMRALDRLFRAGERTDSLLALSRITVEATKVTESGGERPRAEDAVDEVARKRADRRRRAGAK